jgi:thiol-disulfide isomerase/thioredoxin
VSSTKVVYYHTAPWCTPCKTIFPKVQKVCGSLGVELHEINVDKVAPKVQILSVPTIAIYEGEQLVLTLGPDQITPVSLRKALA